MDTFDTRYDIVYIVTGRYYEAEVLEEEGLKMKDMLLKITTEKCFHVCLTLHWTTLAAPSGSNVLLKYKTTLRRQRKL